VADSRYSLAAGSRESSPDSEKALLPQNVQVSGSIERTIERIGKLRFVQSHLLPDELRQHSLVAFAPCERLVRIIILFSTQSVAFTSFPLLSIANPSFVHMLSISAGFIALPRLAHGSV